MVVDLIEEIFHQKSLKNCCETQKAKKIVVVVIVVVDVIDIAEKLLFIFLNFKVVRCRGFKWF